MVQRKTEVLLQLYQANRQANMAHLNRGARATTAGVRRDAAEEAWAIHERKLGAVYETDPVLRGYRTGEVLAAGYVDLSTLEDKILAASPAYVAFLQLAAKLEVFGPPGSTLRQLVELGGQGAEASLLLTQLRRGACGSFRFHLHVWVGCECECIQQQGFQ
jgi:hypothetical protein